LAHKLFRGELSKREAKKKKQTTWYWREREKLEKQLEEIGKSHLVRSFLPAVEFYEPDEVDCSHGRRRKRCQEIHGNLVLLRQMQQPPGNKYFHKRLRQFRDKLRREKIDPEKFSPSDFCAPDFSDRAAKIPSFEDKPPAPVGRPPNKLVNYLLETVAMCLVDEGFSIKKGCECVQAILAYCFNDASFHTDSLVKQWRRLTPKRRAT